jgi:DNA-binding LacI/PurR family transcriptional regulator
MAGIGTELGRTVVVQVTDGFLHTEDATYETMKQELARRQSPPDAVYCSGDLHALGAVRAIREAGLRIPEDVSVVGGSGVDLTGMSCPDLTRTRQPLAQIGRELVTMLCQRIKREGESLPGVVLPTPWVGGGTTRSEENQILGIP